MLSSAYLGKKNVLRLKVAVENSLRDARLAFDKVDEVMLLGGSTRIPAVQELVKKLSGKRSKCHSES